MRLKTNHMLSDNMEKVSLLVGKHCMELSEVILSLSSAYSLYTSYFVNYDSLCTYPGSIQIISLSAEDMQQFASFFSENKILNKIGLSESSLLFIAKCRDIKVAVVDNLTQSICSELGIKTIKAKRKSIEMPMDNSTADRTQTSKFNLFKIAACL